MAAWERVASVAAAASNLSEPLPEGAAPLRRALNRLLASPRFAGYAVMTKQAYNALLGQKPLWTPSERRDLHARLCTRPDLADGGRGRTWITFEYFSQHTSKDAGEVYTLVHLPSMRIDALAAVADFQPPWTAGQFHHMAHACQEDRMFFFGRRSEVKLLPRSKYESSNSFEGGTRFSSHFHMPTLLSVDIVCARPGRRGLAAALLAHIACLQSPFLCERTHLLFDISGREANTRMVSFTQALGAQRYQTFADEARSEGFIGVEGDDPSIFWTYKTGSGYGVNEDRTAGVYAIDQDTGTPITALHPAVLFDDRVTVSDFHRSGSSQPLLDRNAARVAGRNCSYFCLAPNETVQARLAAILDGLADAEGGAAAPSPGGEREGGAAFAVPDGATG
uniref:Uncharacterized protein n=1 Tax=Emiliania huxleyi TaxID=2903 RepID=A0A7S3STT7_EMIHU